MIPSSALLQLMINNLIAGGLAAGNYTCRLSQADFNPLDLGGFVECDFGGYARKAFTSWVNGTDAPAGLLSINANTPAGGFRYTANGGINAPQTIHGFAIYNQDTGALVGAAALTVKPIMRASGDTYLLDTRANFLLGPNALT